MSDDARPRAGVVSARGALAVSLALSMGVLGLSGAGVAGVVGLAGALVVGWGVGALDPSRTRRLAAGSVSVVVGTAALAAAVGLVAVSGRFGHGVVLAGAVTTALAALAGLGGETPGRLTRAVSESGFVALVTLALAVAWFLLVGTGFVPGLVAWAVTGATASPVVAAVWLQVAVLVAGLAVERAGRALHALVPGRGGPESELAASFRLTLDEIPRWYLAALVVTLLVGSSALVRGVVASALAARPLVGRVVDAVLLTGVVHGALGVVVALSLCVAAAPTVHRAVVFWTGYAPGDTVGYAAGGLVAATLTVTASALAALARALDVSAPVAVPSPIAVAVTALVGTLCALVAVAALVRGLALAAGLARRSEGFAVGAALALVGTALLAETLPTLAVVVAATGALAVWDLGVRAVGFERDLRGRRPPVRTELVHATAVGAVLAVAVAAALVVGYFAVPVRIPDDRATVALALVMVSLVAFAVALRE